MNQRQKQYADKTREQVDAAKNAALAHQTLLTRRQEAQEKSEKELKQAQDAGRPAAEIATLTKAVADATGAVKATRESADIARERATTLTEPARARERDITHAATFGDADFTNVAASLHRYKSLMEHIDYVTQHAPTLWLNSVEAQRFPTEVDKRKNSLLSFLHSAGSKLDHDHTLNATQTRELQNQMREAHECLDCIDRIKANYVKLHEELAKPDSDREYSYLGSGPGGDRTDDYQEALDAAANHLGMDRDAAAAASFSITSPATGAGGRTPPTSTGDFEHRWYPADIKYLDKNDNEKVIKGAVVQTQTSGGFITKPMYAKDDLKKFKDLTATRINSTPPTTIPHTALLEEAQKLFLSHMSKKNPFSDTKTITLNNVDKAPSEEFVRAFYLICKKEGYEVIASPASPVLERIKKSVDDNPLQTKVAEQVMAQAPSAEFRKQGIRTASDDTVAKMLEDTEHRPHGPGH